MTVISSKLDTFIAKTLQEKLNETNW